MAVNVTGRAVISGGEGRLIKWNSGGYGHPNHRSYVIALFFQFFFMTFIIFGIIDIIAVPLQVLVLVLVLIGW